MDWYIGVSRVDGSTIHTHTYTHTGSLHVCAALPHLIRACLSLPLGSAAVAIDGVLDVPTLCYKTMQLMLILQDTNDLARVLRAQVLPQSPAGSTRC